MMASKLLLLPLFLSLIFSCAVSQFQKTPQLSEAQQCRLQRLSASQPSRQIQSEGGVTELWEEDEEQFQCAGVAASRNTLRSNSLSLPNYHPTPRLVYVEKGRGYISVILPGCPETFSDQEMQMSQQGQQQPEMRGQGEDQHQKVQRVKKGDLVAIPAGAVHWCYNDGNEDLVAVSINDLNHLSNQLDQKFRSFYLAGGVPNSAQQQQESEIFQNIIQKFDPQIMAAALKTSPEVVQKIQSQEQNNRGLIVNARERMSFIRPDEQQQEEQQGQQGQQGGQSGNSIEESFCTMKLRVNMENRKHTDEYSRGAGKIMIVDRFKLPLLKYMDMSAERGRLYQNALLSPHWSMNSHTIVYVTGGDAQTQVVNHQGQTMMNERVKQGDMFVIPQSYTCMAKAGQSGFEWVAFKTTGGPFRSSLAGYKSVFRAAPLDVLTKSYRMSPNEAQQLKLNRGGESLVLSGSKFSGQPY